MRYQTSCAATLTLILAALVGSSSLASASQIIEAKGSVEIKRSNWSNYRPVGVGTTIKQGDIVQPASGAKVTVLCDDLTFWKVSSGVGLIVDNACPSKTADNSQRAEIEYKRGGINASIPYTISPRYTLLLNDKPTLSWNGVPGAKTYLVRVEGGEVSWQTQVSGTEVVYSGEKPLVSGVEYKFTVEADTGTSSSDEGGPKLGFALLNEENVVLVRKEVAKIAQLDLTEEGKAIALATIYSNAQLNADAIQTLEGLVKQGSQTALVYQMLGDIYAQTGLNLLAEQRYSEAIKLASAPQNWDVLTQAHVGLSGVKIMLGKTEEAEQLANLAQAEYKELGDSTKARELEQRLVTLKTVGNLENRPSMVGKRGGPMMEEQPDIITPKPPKIDRPEYGGFS